MKAFTNASPRGLKEAASLLGDAAKKGQSAAIAGGGSDVLGMIKEHLISPDVLVHLRGIAGLDKVRDVHAENFRQGGGSTLTMVGGLISLDALSRDPLIRENYAVLAEAAGQVGTPQIRNAGTLAGNVAQRPWCWYYRNGFPCYKNGGKTCFSVTGENEFHAIFGGGPSFIVHPSDTAVALLALDAKFRVVSPAGERTVAAADFFKLPKDDPSRENVLAANEILAEVILPAAKAGSKSTYHKVLDRESGTHAVVSAAVVLELNGSVCKSARVVLGGVAPIPWRLPKVEALLAGQRITPELAARAGEAAIEGAQPLAKNGYKVPLTSAVVKRTVQQLGNPA
ncbi:MAG TPA: FAD binding domain-containing protein [Bryobacteraceae bacterium]|nr:FAD binding domain-containing protein [Bryobacteraceae bacterium]